MGLSRLGLVRRESLNRQDEGGGCRVGTKTELRGRGAGGDAGQGTDQNGSTSFSCGLVLVLIGLGSFRAQEGTARTESCSLAGLSVSGQSVKPSVGQVSQSVSLSVSLSVRVGLLGKTATSGQSAGDRSVGR